LQLQLLWLLLLLYAAAKRDRYVHDGAAVCCLLQLKRMSVVVAAVAVDVADVADVGADVVAAVAEAASDLLADAAQSFCLLTGGGRALAGTLSGGAWKFGCSGARAVLELLLELECISAGRIAASVSSCSKTHAEPV